MKDYLHDVNLSYMDKGIMACFEYRKLKNITFKRFRKLYPDDDLKKGSFDRLVKNGYLKREVKSTRIVVYSMIE